MAYDFMKNFESNNQRFKNEISEYIDKGDRTEGHILLGETPPVLALAGADTSLPLVIPCEQINHIVDKHYKDNNNYGKLQKEDTLKLYESIINPVCLISGSEKETCVIITDLKNQDGLNIQIPIFYNFKENNLVLNNIATQYPNRTIMEYVIKEVMKHNLIAANNKKLENLLRPIGLLLPVEHTSISSYDDSIVHNTENVKYSEVNFNKNIYYKFDTDNKYFKPTFKANYVELEKACKELNLSSATNYFYVPDMNVKKETYEFTGIEQYYKEELSKIRNKVIENKTKEIEERLKEVKKMIKNETSNGTQYDIDEINKGFDKSVEENEENKNVLEIEIDWEKASEYSSLNSLIAKELKNKNIDYAYDHHFKIRAYNQDLIVTIHSKDFERIEYIKSFKKIEQEEKQEVKKNRNKRNNC